MGQLSHWFWFSCSASCLFRPKLTQKLWAYSAVALKTVETFCATVVGNHRVQTEPTFELQMLLVAPARGTCFYLAFHFHNYLLVTNDIDYLPEIALLVQLI